MSRTLRYVRPHGADMIGTRITHSTVDAGLKVFGVTDKEIEKYGDLEAKVAWLDRCVDMMIGSSGKAFECVVDNGTGCGSIIGDVDFCPYCGEDLREDDGGAEEARETAAKVVSKAKSTGKGSGKRGRPSLGASFVDLFMTVSGTLEDVEIVERKAYVSVFRKHNGRRDKIAVCVRSTARCHFVIPQVAYVALAEGDQVNTTFYDNDERKKRHIGRDSVELRGQTSEGQLLALIWAAYRNAGSSLDGPIGNS